MQCTQQIRMDEQMRSPSVATFCTEHLLLGRTTHSGSMGNWGNDDCSWKDQSPRPPSQRLPHPLQLPWPPCPAHLKCINWNFAAQTEGDHLAHLSALLSLLKWRKKLRQTNNILAIPYEAPKMSQTTHQSTSTLVGLRLWHKWNSASTLRFLRAAFEKRKRLRKTQKMWIVNFAVHNQFYLLKFYGSKTHYQNTYKYV